MQNYAGKTKLGNFQLQGKIALKKENILMVH